LLRLFVKWGLVLGPGSYCVCFLSSWITGRCHHASLFWIEMGGLS
jgi:hypothetical protein